MFRFALRHMATKRGKLLLIALSIVLSSCVALLAVNISAQVRDGIVTTAGYYDIIVGPAGSATQLAMNTMFFTDAPLGTIPYEVYESLRDDPRVAEAVPFSMGDSFNAARIVGTSPALLEGKPLARGEMFAATCEAVLGSAVAERYGLAVGDEIISSHGLAGHGSEHAATPLKVVGILKTTHTAYDNAVFTGVDTIWAVHGTEADESADGHADESADGHADESADEHADESADEHADESADGHDHAEGEVCAVLVRTKSFSDYYALSTAYGSDASLLAINPTTVLREVLDNIDFSAQIVYLLAGVILVMNVFVVVVVTLLGLYDARREIALMRLIGVRMRTVERLFLLENGLVGLAAAAASLLLSSLCLRLLGDLAASRGIVLDAWAVRPVEWAILAAVFALSVLPTLILTRAMARRDGLA